MAKMKNCKSCEKEVSSSAKVCPHCGQKLKMGKKLPIFGILIVIIIAAVVMNLPSDDEISTELANIENTQPANIPSGELAELFSMNSKNTDIQRDNKEEEIKGKIVQWALTVYEVNISNKEKGIYRIQTSSKSDSAGAFINIHARDAGERTKIEALTTGSKITVKGKITGTTMRNIDIDLARIVN